MSRPIKFRGKCAESGVFVFGDLIHGVGPKSGNIYILPREVNLAYIKHCDPLDGVRVIPETVGQFTGSYCKDGGEIYIGDIVRVVGRKGGGRRINRRYITEVVERRQGFGLKENETYFNDDSCFVAIIEVLGNIHENK